MPFLCPASNWIRLRSKSLTQTHARFAIHFVIDSQYWQSVDDLVVPVVIKINELPLRENNNACNDQINDLIELVLTQM